MKKVLVVDDQADCSEPMARLLRVCGFEAIIAGDGRAALELLETLSPDLILLDLSMPGMDGFEFLRALRGTAKWTRIPVIVFTAFYNEQMHHGLRLLGVHDVFSKGQTDFDILISRIGAITGDKDAGRCTARKILLVEDDQETMAALERLLTDFGYEVTSAATPAAAMEEAKGKDFDLTVVDVGLADRESMQLLGNLLARPEVKSLGLTGDGQRNRGVGFSKMLMKPVPVDTLMETIRGMTSA